MKVTVLGTSNAWGPNPLLNPAPNIPMLGHLSDGTQVEIRRYRTSLLFETSDGKKILVDCGPDFSHQLREFNFGIVDAILITHPHQDHIGGLDELNLYKPSGLTPIPGYAHPLCWKNIREERGMNYIFDDIKLIDANLLFPNSSKATFTIGSVNITPFSVEHSSYAPGAVGFLGGGLNWFTNYS